MSRSSATRRATRAAAGLLVAAVTAASLGACSQDRLGAAGAGSGASVSDAGNAAASDTIDLVSADLDAADLSTVDASTQRPGAGERKGVRSRMLRALHGSWVTKGPDDTWVTHQAIRGTVTAVSATSITVKAADGVSMTFAVTPDTKVRQRDGGTGGDAGSRAGSDSTIGSVRVGATALVAGVGASGPTARVVVFRLAPAPTATGSAS